MLRKFAIGTGVTAGADTLSPAGARSSASPRGRKPWEFGAGHDSAPSSPPATTALLS